MDTPANRALKYLMRAAADSIDPAVGLVWRPGRILYRASTGEIIEITARQLAPHDPDAQDLAKSLAAIDGGDVE